MNSSKLLNSLFPDNVTVYVTTEDRKDRNTILYKGKCSIQIDRAYIENAQTGSTYKTAVRILTPYIDTSTWDKTAKPYILIDLSVGDSTYVNESFAVLAFSNKKAYRIGSDFAGASFHCLFFQIR